MCRSTGGTIREAAFNTANLMRQKKGLPPLQQQAQSEQQQSTPVANPTPGSGPSARTLTGGLLSRVFGRSLLGA